MKKIYLSIIAVSCSFIQIANAQNFEKSLKLNGSSEYVTIPNASNALETNDFTFECWAKRAVSTSRYGKDRMLMSVNTNGWGVFIEANKLKITKVGVSEAQSNGNIADTLWHHLAVTFNGTEDSVCFYIDGTLDSKKKFSYSFASTGSYTIGSRGNGEFFEGQLEEMRIWSVVRDAFEINMNKCSILSGNETGLNRYYKFNEGSGTSIIDASSKAQDGVVTVGTAVWVTSSLACTNSIKEYVSGNTKLYPNPAGNSVYFQDVDFVKPYSISVLNILGETVLTDLVLSTNHQINLTNLNNGVYFVKTSNSSTIKFIKQ